RPKAAQTEDKTKVRVTRMNVEKNPYRKWPNATIPYVISTAYNSSEKAIVLKGMQNIMDVTCIKFKLREKEDDFIFVTPDYANGYNCFSYVGRQGGNQMVKMQGDCVKEEKMTHELIHAIGFGHENQRPDALKYIEIYKDNIAPGYYERAYLPYDPSIYETRNMPYDYDSIQQYPDWAYAKQVGLKTMKAKQAGIDLSQERVKISKGDIAMIKKYYSCK
ncbi:astacin-like protein, partial [Leptotrombidium deliense]